MSDLPHTNEGYIQREETDFRRGTDRVVMKKIGSDQNYLKDFRDTVAAQAASLFGTTCQGATGSLGFTTDGSGNYSNSIFTTPLNQQIVMAFLGVLISSHAGPFPLIVLDALVEMGMVSGSGASTTDTGTYPLLKGQLITTVNPKDTIYAQIINGTASGKSFPTWPPGTSGTLYYSVIYKTT